MAVSPLCPVWQPLPTEPETLIVLPGLVLLGKTVKKCSARGGPPSSASTATPTGKLPPLMKLWLTPVPSRLARPIVPMPPFAQ